MRSNLVAFVSGLLFAVGLALAGMTHPQKVLAFLDPTGGWDPSLAFVMVGAIGVCAIAFRFILRRARPRFAAEFALPERTQVDGRLVVGAALFGLGWGLGGFCPGPAVVSAVTGAVPALVFLGAMLAGMALFPLYERAVANAGNVVRSGAKPASPTFEETASEGARQPMDTVKQIEADAE